MNANAPNHRDLWKIKQMLFGEVLQELDEHFCAMGVRYMPIKGAYMICTGLAKKLDERRMVDIDILVEKANFDKAVQYFAQCPKARLHHDNWYFEQPFFYETDIRPVHVELGFLLNRPQRFHLPTEELFERGNLKTEQMVLPCPEDALAITICHTLVHIAYVFHWAALDDAALIINCGDFSWKRFRLIADRTKISRFIDVFLTITHNEHKEVSIPDDYIMKPGKSLFVKKKIRALYWCMPKVSKRLLFELAFVRSPARLMVVSYMERKK